MTVEVRETDAVATWFRELRDERARDRILVRIRRLSLGNPGDVRPFGEGVCEMCLGYGPGYRLYFVTRGAAAVVLLGGGDKRTQSRDIANAIALARKL